MNFKLDIIDKKYTPRWVVFMVDVFICMTSIILAYLLRFNFVIPENSAHPLTSIVPFLLSVRIISFLISGTYAGVVRYSGIYDTKRIFITILSGSVFVLFCNLINYRFVDKTFFIPTSILIIDFITTLFFMISLRLMIKVIFMEYSKFSVPAKKVIVYGADKSAISAKQILEQDVDLRYDIVAFVDHVKKTTNKRIGGVNIYHTDKLERLIEEEQIDYLILAKPNEPIEQKREIIELCLSHNLKILSVPPIDEWEDGRFNPKKIERIKIEDLLERPEIELDVNNIKKEVSDKVVLVTGAAGSIGSEIVKQVSKFNPKEIILFDQSETPMYDIDIKLKEELKIFNFHVIMGDVVNQERLDKVFKTFKPQIVYHAAAYKHVPMMENNPTEAVSTNIKGTKIIADLSDKYNVEKFVMVSTDKAVNPTNVMGASKRIAEMYIQALNFKSKTNFITTRFGNVLGSNGSVIPRFRKQIEEGGPITVTDSRITRYFMTIPEACKLVLEAAAMGKGGEIFLFDMGKSVKIVDLAKKMITLYGLELDKDIKINFTGLRPGEKLYEELLATKENTTPTHNDKIMIAKVITQDYDKINSQILELIEMLKTQNNMLVVSLMKKIAPEFKSQNSIYEQLDIVE